MSWDGNDAYDAMEMRADLWWESLDYYEQNAYREKWRREREATEAERKRRAAATSELFQCDSVGDALLAMPGKLLLHRTLACTCRAWADRVRAHFKGMTALKLYNCDVAESNAAFVVGPLRALNRKLELHFMHQFALPECTTVCLDEWLRHHDLAGLKKPHRYVRGSDEDRTWRFTHDTMTNTIAFFLGRAIATLPSARIRMNWKEFSSRRHARVVYHTSWLKGPLPDDRARLRIPNDAFHTGYYAIAGCARLAAKNLLGEMNWTVNGWLYLNNIHLDDEGARWVAAQMAKREPRCNNVRRIRLDNTITPVSLGLLGELAKDDNRGGPVDVSQLNELSVAGVPMNERAVQALRDTINRHTMRNLMTLNLCGAKLGAQGMRLIAPHFQQSYQLNRLRQLDLSHNRLDRKGLSAFKAHATCMPFLECLELQHNRLSYVAMREFVRWLGETADWPNIRRVVTDGYSMQTLLDKAATFARARAEWAKVAKGDLNTSPYNFNTSEDDSAEEEGEEEEEEEEGEEEEEEGEEEEEEEEED